MDDLTVFEEEKTYDKSYFSFPEEDYGKDGKLKPVRKRVLKKLLKYEYRALLKPLRVSLFVLIGLTALLFLIGLTLDIDGEDDSSLIVWILALIPYLYACAIVAQVPLIASLLRYRSNIFKKEGYLTMTLPVSAEEHFFAKRIAGVLATYIFAVLVALGFFVALSPLLFQIPAQELWQALGRFIGAIVEEGYGFSAILFLIEFLIIGLLSPVLTYSVLGAIGCWFHRSMSKIKVVFGLIGLYLLYSVGAYLVTSFFENGLLFEITQLGVHTALWLYILAMVGLIVLLSRFEIRTLKHKFNIK